ncbi:MAG TPA: hypothetical protein VGF75_03625 [Candidatus Saccharimonadales bacterium]
MKKHKKLKLTLLLVLLVVVLVLAMLVQQRGTYRDGNRSFIFGQKIDYSQDQSMPLNGLVFSIQKAVAVSFTPRTLPTCNPNAGAFVYGLCVDNVMSAEAYNHAESGNKQYGINLLAKNNDNSVTSLSNYKFSFSSNSVQVLDKSIDNTDITPGSSKSLSFHIRVPQSTKNINLLIDNKGTTKYFEVRL